MCTLADMSGGGKKDPLYSPALRISLSFWPDATKGIMMTARAVTKLHSHTRRENWYFFYSHPAPCQVLCAISLGHIYSPTLFCSLEGRVVLTASPVHACESICISEWLDSSGSQPFLAGVTNFRVQISSYPTFCSFSTHICLHIQSSMLLVMF